MHTQPLSFCWVRVQECTFSYHNAETIDPYYGSHTHRPHSSSFLGFPYRILYMNPQKELLWGLWVIKFLDNPVLGHEVPDEGTSRASFRLIKNPSTFKP